MSDLVFVQSYAPHGSIKGQEVLDACLMGSAFANCALLFVGDGLYQIRKNQSTKALGVKDYSVSYGVLEDYGVTEIYCLVDELTDRGLTLDDLTLNVTPLQHEALCEILAKAKQVLTF